MIYKLNIVYQRSDFTKEDMQNLENNIMQEVKLEDRIFGTSIIWHGVVFAINGLFYDLDSGTKILEIKQVTTKSKIQRLN